MEVPQSLYYTKEHEWAKVEGDVAIIGITDYAQGELGDVVFVELPTVGAKAHIGKPFGTIEAVKAVADLFAPLSGEIVGVNSALEDHPELVNQSPYDEGWMVKIKMTDRTELTQLLSSDVYKKMLEGQK
jgi:glycine cleavage system H protein